ncbi:hypothetical protein M5K25_022148 [Dendrobium thyrsiflorum]|uniref:Uncharacterized protein n=1 Tax=Dendrobium thyrsiflorum TaxID=117978 RepID=A0ABD0UBI6_DENTH
MSQLPISQEEKVKGAKSNGHEGDRRSTQEGGRCLHSERAPLATSDQNVVSSDPTGKGKSWTERSRTATKELEKRVEGRCLHSSWAPVVSSDQGVVTSDPTIRENRRRSEVEQQRRSRRSRRRVHEIGKGKWQKRPKASFLRIFNDAVRMRSVAKGNVRDATSTCEVVRSGVVDRGRTGILVNGEWRTTAQRSFWSHGA